MGGGGHCPFMFFCVSVCISVGKLMYMLSSRQTTKHLVNIRVLTEETDSNRQTNTHAIFIICPDAAVTMAKTTTSPLLVGCPFRPDQSLPPTDQRPDHQHSGDGSPALLPGEVLEPGQAAAVCGAHGDGEERHHQQLPAGPPA